MQMTFLEPFVAPIRDSDKAQALMFATFCAIAADWVFGTAIAFLMKEYSSEKARHGMVHKGCFVGMLMVGVLLDGVISTGFSPALGKGVFVATCLYVCLTECMSLMETFVKYNPQAAGAPILRTLKKAQEAIAAAEGGEE